MAHELLSIEDQRELLFSFWQVANGGSVGKLWRDYNLSIVLLGLFLASWLGQGIFQWFEIANEAQAHGETNTLAEFIPAFFSATFENWQSEFLQLFTMVVLTAYLVHKGSHESKDTDEKFERALARIEQRLERMEQNQVLSESTSDRGTPVPAAFRNGQRAELPTPLRSTQND